MNIFDYAAEITRKEYNEINARKRSDCSNMIPVSSECMNIRTPIIKVLDVVKPYKLKMPTPFIDDLIEKQNNYAARTRLLLG